MSDPDIVAPLLSLEVAAQAQRIGALIRRGEVAPLVGAGLSVACGFPTWRVLVERLILAWKVYDESDLAKSLPGAEYIDLVKQTFGRSDPTVISYLRRRMATLPSESFSQLLYAALYLDKGTNPISPGPNLVHRHLVALFGEDPGKVWTTNYDDLIEEAARLIGTTDVRTLDSKRRIEGRGLSVAHVHGFLPPPDRAAGHPPASEAQVVLSEDDFHFIATDVTGWTNREFHTIFDEHYALILGMSLDDPNVRRVLSAISLTGTGTDARHFAVMAPRPRTTEDRYTTDCLAWYWRAYGVEFVQLPDYESILSFLMRLRYESYGDNPGDLFRRGAAMCGALDAWQPSKQVTAFHYLSGAIQALRHDFAILEATETIEVGGLFAEGRGHSGTDFSWWHG